MMFFTMGMVLQTVAPAGLVIWMAFYVQRRLARQAAIHVREMERLTDAMQAMQAPREIEPVKAEPVPLVEDAVPMAPLPVARVHVR